MKKWKKAALCAGIATGVLFSGALQAEPTAQAAAAVTTPATAQNGIQSVSVIARVYGDGEKPAFAVVTYPKAIDGTKLSADDFSVEGQTIESVTTNVTPNPTPNKVSGRYVLLKLAHTNMVYDGDLAKQPGHEKKMAAGAQRNSDKMQQDAPMHSDRQLPDLTVKVKQLKDIKAIDGTVYHAKGKTVTSSSVSEPEIEQFQQFTYTDPETGYQLPCNIYLPKGYDSSKKYPLLFFVADASADINVTATPLFQGNGATVWTEPEAQAKHPCIVFAPQYTDDLINQIGMLTADSNTWTPGLTLVSHALQSVIDNYAVDTNRIYGTGQSQGGMTNIALSDKYPNLFAAQWLVACQWNTDEMKVLKDKNLWITVCEGDTKAHPGMDEAVAKWEALGTKVAKNDTFWDSKAPLSTINQQVKDLEKQNAHINYTVFAGGNHMYTWSFAYNIEAIRDWLFSQSKDGTPVKNS
ncbi:prolyl oligopeptidase family serine peptidase [Mitsuokella sp. WILCCON 0060]|uniref:prolyl oligopeptidase family serine peptidase n=1 Tax=Mitsuokella sp. WILCCON 0060 TaxID=3345341 RepID=UPI003F1932B6